MSNTNASLKIPQQTRASHCNFGCCDCSLKLVSWHSDTQRWQFTADRVYGITCHIRPPSIVLGLHWPFSVQTQLGSHFFCNVLQVLSSVCRSTAQNGLRSLHVSRNSQKYDKREFAFITAMKTVKVEIIHQGYDYAKDKDRPCYETTHSLLVCCDCDIVVNLILLPPKASFRKCDQKKMNFTVTDEWWRWTWEITTIMGKQAMLFG